MAYRFPEADNLKTPYDDALLKNKVTPTESKPVYKHVSLELKTSPQRQGSREKHNNNNNIYILCNILGPKPHITKKNFRAHKAKNGHF